MHCRSINYFNRIQDGIFLDFLPGYTKYRQKSEELYRGQNVSSRRKHQFISRVLLQVGTLRPVIAGKKYPSSKTERCEKNLS